MNQDPGYVPKVEIRIPISANEKFLRMTHYLLESIQAFGGPLAKAAHCVVSVSRDEPYRDLYEECRWTKDYSIEFRWVDPELFEKYGYDGTGMDRYYVESDADIILFCDADILVAGDFDDVILRSFREKKELGFIAHVSPFNNPKFQNTPSSTWWRKLHKKAGLSPPNLNQQHTGRGIIRQSTEEGHKKCPYYFNYGFIVTLKSYSDKIATTFEKELETVDDILDTWFKSQIALPLSYNRHQISCGTLSLNYNFPLHIPEEDIREVNPDKAGKNSANDIIIFHYLGNGDFNKDDFATEQSLQDALNRETASTSRQTFVNKLRVVHQRIKAAAHEQKKIISSDSGEKDPAIYIICGGRRTGTTLMAAILASDPRSNPLGQEAQILTRMIETYKWSKDNFENFGQSFFDNLKTYQSFFADTMINLTNIMTAFASIENILILKNPEISTVIKETAELFPNATLIATVRDPRDQICSELEVGKRRKAAGIPDKNYDSRNIRALARSYMSYISKLLEFSSYSSRLHVFQYEDLVLNFSNTLNRLKEITGLELTFDPSQKWIRVSEYAGLDISPSRSDLYGTPINSSSVGRYYNELTQDEIKVIEDECSALMDAYRYESHFVGKTK